MRSFLTISLAVLVAAACGDNGALKPDASHEHPATDASQHTVDAFAFLDAPADATGIGAAITDAGTGSDVVSGLTVPITGVTVTYIKPALGNLADDPAGFTIQAVQAGPGLFVAVDPATLSPALSVGDVVGFTVTSMQNVDKEPRVLALSGLARTATGTNVSALARNISTATDVVTNLAAYDSTIVTVTGAFAGNFTNSGTAFESAPLDTAGISGNASLTFRSPATLVTALEMANMCTVTATNIPVDRFNSTVELGAYAMADLAVTTCPAPVISGAVALAPMSVQLAFSRNIDPATVVADGSQFTADNGLTFSAAVTSGHTVTLMSTAQTSGTAYTITVAAGLADLSGTALAPPLTVGFGGFQQPAGVVINEVNANVNNGCDLIELRVTADGSMGGFKLFERVGSVSSTELNFTFPAGFNVAKNAIIMVHDSSGSATCNPGGATQELTSPIDQPAATYGSNYDTAYDFWATDAGLVATDNVITLYDSTGAIIDAVFLESGASGATDTLAQAGVVGTANQWLPAQASYTAVQFAAAAVPGLGSTSKTVTGSATSLQRVNDTDTNGSADWATAVQTFGVINAGQATLPTLRHRRR